MNEGIPCALVKLMERDHSGKWRLRHSTRETKKAHKAPMLAASNKLREAGHRTLVRYSAASLCDMPPRHPMAAAMRLRTWSSLGLVRGAGGRGPCLRRLARCFRASASSTSSRYASTGRTRSRRVTAQHVRQCQWGRGVRQWVRVRVGARAPGCGCEGGGCRQGENLTWDQGHPIAQLRWRQWYEKPERFVGGLID